MATRHIPWDGRSIDELPQEILNYNIKETPRATLKDIANRLNADSISSGNWESLAEKLGITQSSMLELLIEEARVQNTYPGLLMLQRWAGRAGSTAFVLLHALREIQREDVVQMLVAKLYELHTMQLSVSVQDRTGCHQFLRVRTRKSAPLHASLENMLQKSLYWYDITGPCHDVSWNTEAGRLQGTQLTLRVRDEPSLDTRNQIYGPGLGTSQLLPGSQPYAIYQPATEPAFSHTVFHATGNESPAVRPQAYNTQLELNIPLVPPNVSVTIPVSDPSQFNMKAEGCGVRIVNNLSSSPRECAEPSPLPQGPWYPGGQTGDQPASYQHLELPQSSGSLEILPNILRDGSWFTSPMDSLSSSTDYEFSTSLKQTGGGGGGATAAAGMDFSQAPTSCTQMKEPVACEHDERSGKEMGPGAAFGGQGAEVGREESARVVRRPQNPTSCLHPDYISVDSLKFCNDSPQNNASKNSSPENTPSMSWARERHREPAVPSSTSQRPSQIVSNRATPPLSSKDHANAGYVSHAFILEQSEITRSASAPAQFSSDCRQTEASSGSEKMDCSEKQDYQLGNTSLDHFFSAPLSGGSLEMSDPDRPAPCSYTSYRPDMVSFRPPPALTHSRSVDEDGRYLCMWGGRRVGPSHGQEDRGQPSTLGEFGLPPYMSVDSYMNDCSPDFELSDIASQSLDSGIRNRSFPELEELHSRTRRTQPSSNDVFQPRNRRPLTREHDMLLDEVTGPMYSYIDPRSIGRSIDPPYSGPARTTGPGARKASCDQLDDRPSSASKELLESELQEVPGWNPSVTDRTVDQEMVKYINEDGNFIVWRYDIGQKYVISVSHLRSIRHYAVYATEREGQRLFYIFPKGSRFTSLALLVQHYQKHGVSEPTKTFRTPDGRAHQGGGNCSHVRLKMPIPPRKKN